MERLVHVEAEATLLVQVLDVLGAAAHGMAAAQTRAMVACIESIIMIAAVLVLYQRRPAIVTGALKTSGALRVAVASSAHWPLWGQSANRTAIKTQCRQTKSP